MNSHLWDNVRVFVRWSESQFAKPKGSGSRRLVSGDGEGGGWGGSALYSYWSLGWAMR